jgi:hypothetical protein
MVNHEDARQASLELLQQCGCPDRYLEITEYQEGNTLRVTFFNMDDLISNFLNAS